MNVRSLALVTTLAIACGGRHTGFGDEPSNANDGGATDDGQSPPPGLDTPDAAAPQDAGDDCPDELKQIFVVTLQRSLYSFSPQKLSFTKIGDLTCAMTSSPFSMAVDRKGTAWVLYGSGDLYAVDTKTAACKPSGYAPGQQGYSLFGMGFVWDAKTKTDTLYVWDDSTQLTQQPSKGLGTIDTSSLKLSPIGSNQSDMAELTGTGAGDLYALFSSSVAHIDRATGNVITTKQTGVSTGNAWAFAFWGGAFWLFTATNGPTQVTRFDFGKGTSNVVVANAGFTVDGAGVSTCAPVEPPPVK